MGIGKALCSIGGAYIYICRTRHLRQL